jgi:hypothetical protein
MLKMKVFCRGPLLSVSSIRRVHVAVRIGAVTPPLANVQHASAFAKSVRVSLLS